MRSWIFLFLCNFLWALQFTCIKLVQTQVGSLATVWGPMLIATLMLYPMVRSERRSASASSTIHRSHAMSFIVLALLGVLPAQLLTTYGTRLSTASNAAIIVLAIPVFTAFLAFLLLKERMTVIRTLGFAVALAGVLLCSTSDFQHANFSLHYFGGNALILIGALGSAFYNAFSKKLLAAYSPMRTLFYTYIACTTLMLPLVISQEGDVFARIPNFTLSTWCGLALLAVIHNFLSMVLFLKALTAVDATQAALSNYLITFFGIPIAAIWLGERLNGASLVGGAFVLTGTLLTTIWEARQAAKIPAKLSEQR